MKNVYPPEYYKALETYKPIAVRQYVDSINQTRYAWNEAPEITAEYADQNVWMPALGDEYHHIQINNGFLMSKARAEHEAKTAAKHLLIGLSA